MLAKHALYQLSYGPSPLAGSAGVVVGPGGLEPPTSRLSGVCSNQLSYRPETITPHPSDQTKAGAAGGKEIRRRRRPLPKKLMPGLNVLGTQQELQKKPRAASLERR